ncbi:MAG TPA: hypothetical protein VFS59_01005 [Gemmatimonadaceae bacterium]|nr:hypothetical protein [Gemmatimonadaceae bacterium]
MSAATKSALLLAVTLALGLVLGAVGAGALERRRREEVGGLRRPPGFARHVLQEIVPRDSAQAALLRPIVARTAERNQAIMRDANARLRSSIDSMRTELAPLLDDAQRARLARMTRLAPPFGPPRPGMPGRRGGRPFGPPDGRGPPPGPGGPPPP